MREALINCIIHQDVNAQGHNIVERTDDSFVFMNPGMLLDSRQQYFEGGRSICRNPTLQKMFMLLGRAEKAGSGVDKIVSGWQYLGWPHPTVAEEMRPDYVVLTLRLGVKTTQENPSRRPIKKNWRKRQILEFCEKPKSFCEIMDNIGLKDRVSFKRLYINPMIEEGVLAMTEPDNPTSRNQMYVTVQETQKREDAQEGSQEGSQHE